MNASILWDVPSLFAQVARERRDGYCEVALRVDALGDPRKVLVLESRIRAVPGVQRVTLDPASRTVRVIWHRPTLSLDALLSAFDAAQCPATPLRSDAIDDARSPELHDALKRMLVAGMCAMQVMTYAAVIYLGVVDFVDFTTRGFFRWMGFVLTVPVVLYSAQPFVVGAWRELATRRPGLNLPVALAVWLVFLASAWNTVRGSGEIYFDSVTMFVFLLLAARYVELRARQLGGAHREAARDRRPLLARLIHEDGSTAWMPAVELRRGDLVRLETEADVAADGRIVRGALQLDHSAFTGESSIRHAQVGDRVLAGARVLGGEADVRVEQSGRSSLASRLLEMTDAAGHRDSHEPRADQRLTRFVLAILVMTAITAIGWGVIAPARAFEAAVAVLVVACPCSYALTRPCVTVRLQGLLMKQGVLVSHGETLLRLAQIDCAIFDKTGTLTSPRVVDVESGSLPRETAFRLAATLARESAHPWSRAILDAYPAALPHRARDVHETPGQGLVGEINGQRLWLGRRMDSRDVGVTLGDERGPIAEFMVEERVRPDAAPTLGALAADGIACVLASGDEPSRVDACARELGFTEAHAELDPEAKVALLRQWRHQGHVVLMIGDGSNDAPALAQADVSATLASGTDLAQSTADILLASGKLDGLLAARRASRDYRDRIDEGERWSLVYNLAAVPFAAFGLVPPWLAALGMGVSSLWIVLRAIRRTVPRPES